MSTNPVEVKTILDDGHLLIEEHTVDMSRADAFNFEKDTSGMFCQRVDSKSFLPCGDRAVAHIVLAQRLTNGPLALSVCAVHKQEMLGPESKFTEADFSASRKEAEQCREKKL